MKPPMWRPTVSKALPDMQNAIAEIARAGEAVLGTADDLVDARNLLSRR